MFSASVARVLIYPIKSLDGVEVSSVEVLPSGTLAGDRRLAIVDQQGKFVNGKRHQAVHGIRATYSMADASNGTVRLEHTATGTSFEGHLNHDHDQLAKWLSQALGFKVSVVENSTDGFPDDTEAPGPTIISTQSLTQVASWFPGLSVEEARRRFRANIELEAAEPFAEDALFGAANKLRVIAIGGNVTLNGTNPCQRCVVPTRDTSNGEATNFFQKTFAERREAELPAYADRSRFNHFYRLAVNTQLLDRREPAVIHVEDRVYVR